jgi:aminopeptidase-like protein
MSEITERMQAFIEKYCDLNRVPVGDDTSYFAQSLATTLGATILSVPSGAECLTWLIPPRWTVNQAYLETVSGERIVDFDDHPLYLKSYSAPFSGEISRQELLDHIFTNENNPDAILYDYRAQYQYGTRSEWGFSLPYNLVHTLTEPEYRVHIDVTFDQGTLDVVDWVLPGETSQTIFFAAHTCHPALVNDGIACIAVIIELFQWLQQKKDRRYTYRAIFGPEYFAAAALLAHGKNVDDLTYGYFLDMVGNGQPLGFSHSFRADTLVDKVTANVMSHQVGEHLAYPYRGLWGNDELFYDGPGFGIPTIGLGREHFDDHHTDKDSLENCNFAQIEETLRILQKIVEVFETDCVPRRTYRGPLYLSRYGLYIDPKKDRKGYKNLQNIQILIDGRRTCLDIAHQLDIDFFFVRNLVSELEKRDLVTVI